MQTIPITNRTSRRAPLMQAAARWSVLPAALAIYAVAVTAIRGEWFPRPEMAFMGALLLTAALATAAERALPFRQDWAEVSRRERQIDRKSWLALVALVDPFLELVVMPLLLALAMNVAPGLTELRLFSNAWIWPLQWLVAVLLAGLGAYWMHALANGTAVMWGIHSFHHNPARLYWLNGIRVNPLNIAWHQLASVFVLALLGAPDAIVKEVVALGVVVGVMQHCNADVRYDGWNLFFGTADLHRWRHAVDADEARSDFGTLTIFGDRVFGTYRRGHLGPNSVGIKDDEPANAGYLSDLSSAYRRNSRWRARLGIGAPPEPAGASDTARGPAPVAQAGNAAPSPPPRLPERANPSPWSRPRLVSPAAELTCCARLLGPARRRLAKVRTANRPVPADSSFAEPGPSVKRLASDRTRMPGRRLRTGWVDALLPDAFL